MKTLEVSEIMFLTFPSVTAFWECSARGDFDPSKPGPDPSAKPLLMRMEPESESAAAGSDPMALESEENEREIQTANILKETAFKIMEEKNVPRDLVFQDFQGVDPDMFFQ